MASKSTRTATAPGDRDLEAGDSGHAACVDQWLERSRAKGLPRVVLLDLFEAALLALWASTRSTLGEVTLTAIADRVLHNAAEEFPAFASLKVEQNGRIQARDLREKVDDLHHQKLLEAMRSVLVDFLTVIGNLTAELLSTELHAELLAVAPKPAAGLTSRRPARAKKTDR